jgi:Trk-type K+ transport system membrane component
MWWLALSLWLICIIEVSAKAHRKRTLLTRQRTRIIGNAEEPWFNIFSVSFEIVSAYGTVGLSLGSSNANFS